MEIDKKQLIETLGNALSQQYGVLKVSEQQLNEWQSKPAFYIALGKLLANQSLHANIRWMAAVLLSQGVQKYWFQHFPSILGDEAKNEIRCDLFAVFNEPVAQVAVKIASIISEIARFDYPNYWLNLIIIIMGAVKQNGDILQVSINNEPNIVPIRGLLVLKYVVKRLSAKRLPNSRVHFYNITYDIYVTISDIWKMETDLFLSAGNLYSLEKATNALKILEKMIIYGCNPTKLKENGLIKNDVNLMFEKCRQMLAFRQATMETAVYKPLVEKFTNRLIKIFLRLADIQPLYFVQEFSMNTIELTTFYLFSAEGKHYLYDQLRFNLLKLLENVLKLLYSQSRISTNHCRVIVANVTLFFASDVHRFKEIISSLIFEYFKLTESELRLWYNKPEEFVLQEINDDLAFNLRSIATSLYEILTLRWSDIVNPLLNEYFQMFITTKPVMDVETILQKEAVYWALENVSLCYPFEFNFDDWVNNILVAEMENQELYSRILRRRLVHVMTFWYTSKLSPEVKAKMYDVFLECLGQHNDYVVRFTSCMCLETFLKYEAEAEKVTPYLENILKKLHSLIQDTHDCELKIKVLEVMVSIVNVNKEVILLFLNQFEAYIPVLWDESRDHNMLRCSIVSVLKEASKSLGSNCVILFKYTLPIISLGIDVNTENSVYLLEYCLNLLQTILRNTKSSDADQLVPFCSYIPQILEHSSEYNVICFRIIREYILMIQDTYLQNYGFELMKTCGNLLPDLRDECIGPFSKLFEASFILSPRLSTEVIKVILIPIFKLLISEKRNISSLKFLYLIVGRLLLSSTAVFFEYVFEFSREYNELYLDIIVKKWLHVCYGYCSKEENKIYAMALSSLLTIRTEMICSNFSEIVRSIFDSLRCILETHKGEEYDCLWVKNDYTDNSVDDLNSMFNSKASLSDCSHDLTNSSIEPEPDWDMQCDIRNANLLTLDPVYHLDIRRYLKNKFSIVRQQYPPEMLNTLLNPLIAEYSNQISKYFL